jgi:hypothetical protein
MSSSKNPEGTIHFRSASGPVELRLVNHRFQTVASGYGEIHKKLPAGIYRLEMNAGPVQETRYIDLEPGETVEDLNIYLPFPSAAPVRGTTTSHESHGYPADDLSRNPTRSYGQGGRLLLFFRNVGDDRQAPLNIDSFSLLNASLKPLGDLPADVVRNEADGWAALSADIEPGGYVLRNTRKPRRSWSSQTPEEEPVDQSLWVSEGWTTIVFIPNWSGRMSPSLHQASIHMAQLWAGFSYDGAEQVNLALELALSGLRQGRPVVPQNLLDLLLDEKFKNPMLGIVGAHAMLLEPKPRWELFDIVRRNLQRLTPGHPDVIALYVIGKERRVNEAHSRVEPVSWPPMLYTSYRGLIERNAQEPGLIVANSMADRAAAYLYQQGPWSMWKSFELTTGLGQVISTSILMGESMMAKTIDLDDELLEQIAEIKVMVSSPTDPAAESVAHIWSSVQEDSEVRPGELDDPEVQQVVEYLQQFSRQAARGRESASGQPMKVEDISKRVGLPVSAVKRAIRTISEQG